MGSGVEVGARARTEGGVRVCSRVRGLAWTDAEVWQEEVNSANATEEIPRPTKALNANLREAFPGVCVSAFI